ncbi:hypothetical protein AB0K34_13495 [Actinomadura sp. NPDC049382]|uniref:hypothetical protein n=1 Tax=Actinomadura sp. NPDC049382 TaxID=3158220 RepID=UPI00343C807B
MSISVDDISILDALTRLDADAAHSGAPVAYIHAIRTGAPGSRHRITVNGAPAHITIGTPAGESGPPRDAADSFTRLRNAMQAATIDGIQPQLPPEISMVTWRHNDQELRICAPGAAPTLRRARERVRRRLTALSPLPLLGTLTQPLTGSATAVGIALAPVVPPMHTTPPPAPVVRELGGEIARPELPYMLGLHVTAPAAPRFAPIKPPDEATAPDSSPRPTADPAPPNRAPAATPTTGTSTSPAPTGSPLPEASSISPAPAPPQTDPTAGTPLDVPQNPPSISSPAPAARTAPSTSHTPRGHGYGHRHGKHKRPSHRRH